MQRMENTNILLYVQAELKRRKGHLPTLCNEFSGISYSWINKVMTGVIDNPGVRQVQMLYDYFKQEEELETQKKRLGVILRR
jgi:hypothetical protein